MLLWKITKMLKLCKDDVDADLRAMKITNWKTSIEDKLDWKKIVEQVKTHLAL
jgi:hypothetical protein